MLYHDAFLESLPPYDGARENPFVVAMAKRTDAWMRRRRARLEEWFAGVGDGDEDLRRRLTGFDDESFESAEYEILVHAILRARTLEPEWKPLIDGTTPDLAANIDGRRTVVEVLTRMRPAVLSRRDRRITVFRAALADGGLVSLQLKEEIPEAITDQQLPRLARQISRLLGSPADGQVEGVPVDLAPFGMSGSVARVAKELVTVSVEPVILGDDTNAVREELVDKAKRYKKLAPAGVPYVIAVCKGSRSLVDRWSVEQAFLGREMISIPIVPGRGAIGQAEVTRKLDGAVRPAARVGGRPRYSRISAVAFVARKDEDARTLYQFLVLHNPWAHNKLSAGAFQGLPEMVWRVEDNMYVGKWTVDPDTWFEI